MFDAQATVTLDTATIARVVAFSDRIHAANRKRRRRHAQGFRPRGKESIEKRRSGYYGEAAFAQWMGVPWRPHDSDSWLNGYLGADVAGYEVRTSTLVTARLIITPRDPDVGVFVLVIDRLPRFDICGLFPALEAKTHSEWWEVHRENGGGWYVPRSALRRIEQGKALARNPLELARPILEAVDQHRKAIDEVVSTDWRAVLRAKGIEPPPSNYTAETILPEPKRGDVE